MAEQNVLNDRDRELIASRGISEKKVYRQLEMFKHGAVPVALDRPATIGDGITRFSAQEEEELTAFFNREAKNRKLLKFVPASGAASRMFQTLQEFSSGTGKSDEAERAFLNDFITGVKEEKFAFLDDLKKALNRDGHNLDTLLSQKDYRTIIDHLLQPQGLDYAQQPKALIKFHRYKNRARSALEEHLAEGAAYAKDKNNVVHIHLTISPEFKERFVQHIDAVKSTFEVDGTTFDIQLSEQKPSTDTIAVDEHNHLFRDESGSLVLRPGGHGALIENLDDLHADIVFIKNIDNVVPAHLMAETVKYKKILGGHLLRIQCQLYDFLEILSGKEVSEKKLAEMQRFAGQALNISFPPSFDRWPAEQKRGFLFNKLSRPMRVCGMVKNEGEPGGGPFWVKERDGTLSLQIVEKAQIDQTSARDRELLARSSHFNPVDLVCGITDFNGEKFNLLNFVDPETYFISRKSRDGRILKAMELPGLWNGAMGHWLTIFVEVPITTFNPVKTVNDLLRTSTSPNHRINNLQLLSFFI